MLLNVITSVIFLTAVGSLFFGVICLFIGDSVHGMASLLLTIIARQAVSVMSINPRLL
jgi:hypothetical protein